MRIALLGAGRIGRLHARLLPRHTGRRRASSSPMPIPPGPQRSPPRSARHRRRADHRGRPRRRRRGRHRGGHERPRRAHPDLDLARPADVLREAARRRTSATRSRSPPRSNGAGVPFQLGFQRRFDPGYREARRLVESGDLGDALRRSPRRPRPCPAARVLHPTVGRPVPRLLDPRLRRPALADRPRGGRGLRRRRHPRLPRLRKYDDVDTAVATLRLTTGHSRC